MRKRVIEAKVDRAISMLKEKDRYLIEYFLHEQSLSHRLAVYLENLFPKKYNVDCEYNKKMDIENNIVNKSVRKSPQLPASETRDIRPDITIHKRGKNNRKSNLLVIQIKKKENLQDRNEDIESLKELTDQDGEYQYQYGLFLYVDNVTSEIKKRWFPED